MLDARHLFHKLLTEQAYITCGSSSTHIIFQDQLEMRKVSAHWGAITVSRNSSQSTPHCRVNFPNRA